MKDPGSWEVGWVNRDERAGSRTYFVKDVQNAPREEMGRTYEVRAEWSDPNEWGEKAGDLG
jgi:hypothetical protein